LALESNSTRFVWHPGEKINCAAASAVTHLRMAVRHAGRRGTNHRRHLAGFQQAKRLGADRRCRRRIAAGSMSGSVSVNSACVITKSP